MLVSVHGYMGRRPRIDSISVFDLEELTTKAQDTDKYNPDMPVAKIRAERFASQEIQAESEKKKENKDEPKIDKKRETKKVLEQTAKSADKEFEGELKYTFHEPTNPGKKMKLQGILKSSV